MIRRLDHVAIAVTDTDTALTYFRDRLGLRVVATDYPPVPAVRLTYLDAGGITIQLVEPLDESGPLSGWLAEHGEGLHHICFEVDDLSSDVEAVAGAPPATVGSGRGRPAAFLPGPAPHGVAIEMTVAPDDFA